MKYIYVTKIKTVVKLVLFIATLFMLLVFSKENLNSVKETTTIFLQSVFPSLFPFILFTNVVLSTNIADSINKIIGKGLSFVFNISSKSSIALITGYLCGFPMGAKTVSSLYSRGKISYDESKKLLSFTNNCNPSFILSTIGVSMFSSIKIGVLLCISHYISSIIIGIIYTRINSFTIIHEKSNFLNSLDENSGKVKKKEKSDFFNIVKRSVLNTFVTLGVILGFMVIFNLLFSLVSIYLKGINLSNTVIAFISSIFEVTKGCSDISVLNIALKERLVMVSFALGFSGISIIMQIYSTISDFKFKLKDILIPKIIQGIISATITYILVCQWGRFLLTQDVSLLTHITRTVLIF